MFLLFLIFWSAVRPSTWYDGQCWTIWLSYNRQGHGTYSEKTCPSTIHLPHDLTWDRTPAAAVDSRRLTAWPMLLPYSTLLWACRVQQTFATLIESSQSGSVFLASCNLTQIWNVSDEYRSADDRIASPLPIHILSISSYWDARYRMTRRGIIYRDDGVGQ
jgi:hypothetical protein